MAQAPGVREGRGEARDDDDDARADGSDDPSAPPAHGHPALDQEGRHQPVVVLVVLVLLGRAA
ncbi:MAG TPA: hypothetical protein VH299_14600 [Solirubrobacterales bacterium]|nr:hypothetical protein [Solirubrobacterales bacterium]